MNAQTAIATRTETSQPIRWFEPSLPTKLDTLVAARLNFNDLPVVGPVSAGHLREYVAGMQPPRPDRDQVGTMLARLALAMPSARMTDQEASERLSIYWNALRSHALPDLQDAFAVILRKCRFFPTIAEIEEVVAPIRGRRTRREAAARMLILKHEKEWAPVDDVLTKEEAAELGKILADPLAQRGDKQ